MNTSSPVFNRNKKFRPLTNFWPKCWVFHEPKWFVNGRKKRETAAHVSVQKKFRRISRTALIRDGFIIRLYRSSYRLIAIIVGIEASTRCPFLCRWHELPQVQMRILTSIILNLILSYMYETTRPWQIISMYEHTSLHWRQIRCQGSPQAHCRSLIGSKRSVHSLHSYHASCPFAQVGVDDPREGVAADILSSVRSCVSLRMYSIYERRGPHTPSRMHMAGLHRQLFSDGERGRWPSRGPAANNSLASPVSLLS